MNEKEQSAGGGVGIKHAQRLHIQYPEGHRAGFQQSSYNIAPALIRRFT
jgi:hypothetical protein